MAEYEYFCANSAAQVLKYSTSRSVDCHIPELNRDVDLASDPKPPVLLCFAGDVIFSWLEVTQVPFALSFDRVAAALITLVNQAYYSFLSEQSWVDAKLHEVVLRVDEKIHAHVLKPISRRLTSVCSAQANAAFQDFTTNHV